MSDQNECTPNAENKVNIDSKYSLRISKMCSHVPPYIWLCWVRSNITQHPSAQLRQQTSKLRACGEPELDTSAVQPTPCDQPRDKIFSVKGQRSHPCDPNRSPIPAWCGTCNLWRPCGNHQTDLVGKRLGRTSIS